MTEIKQKIIDAAIEAFLRFGARKTSMGDIAAGAGVSRQTLYDQFGSKDEIIVASIRFLTEFNLAAVRKKLDDRSTLAEKLSAYSEESIVKSFEMLQSSRDAQELIGGHNEAGKAEMQNSLRKHEALIGDILSPHAERFQDAGTSVAQYAHFYVTSAMAFKYAATDRSDLDQLINALVSTTIRIATMA